MCVKVLRSKPDSRFLFLTKNPRRYHEFREGLTENMILGATIETNRAYKLTKAPTPRERYEAMKKLSWKRRAIVIEPILDFDIEFIDWIREISLESVYVGYDNYHNKLPEPRLNKTEMLVNELRQITDVTAKSLRKALYEKQ